MTTSLVLKEATRGTNERTNKARRREEAVRLTQKTRGIFLSNAQWLRVHFHEEIILDEQVTTYSEQIYDDHREHGSQDDRLSVAYNTLNDIPQCIFTIDNIK